MQTLEPSARVPVCSCGAVNQTNQAKRQQSKGTGPRNSIGKHYGRELIVSYRRESIVEGWKKMEPHTNIASSKKMQLCLIARIKGEFN